MDFGEFIGNIHIVVLWSNECSSLQALGYTAVARACPKEVYKRQDVAAISGLLRTDQRT